MVTEPKPRPPFEYECVWCLEHIPHAQVDEPCPKNDGQPHVRWLFDAGTGLKEELRNEH